mgnify:FL=1
MKSNAPDYQRIMAALSPSAAQAVSLTVYDRVGSTNDVVRDRGNTFELKGFTVLAEEQTRGRGRRGKVWHSPAGGNLYLSMGWEFDLPPTRLAGLSLAVGAMLADAFAKALDTELQLKWPNDFYFDGRKLGGILVEMLPERDGRQRLVLGVGLNVQMPALAPGTIDRAWTDLSRVIGAPVDRNRLAALIIDTMVLGLDHYDAHGFSHWLSRWRGRDFLLGRSVTVGDPAPIIGTAAGVNEEGALLIETPTGRRTVSGGEVSVLEFGGLS